MLIQYAIVITDLIIPNTIDTIKPYAFCNNKSITSVTILNSVKCIGNFAFSGCSGLTSITIPNSVTSIGERAFYNCSNLAQVNFNADSCIYMGNSTYPVFAVCANLSIINIGNNVKHIPAYAFSGCSGLTSVTISNSIISIGNGAFSNCSRLAQVNFNAENCYTSGKIFSGCSNLSTLCIGNKVRYIPDSTFYNCSGLRSVTFYGAQTRIMGTGAFAGVPNTTPIYIPCGSTAWYIQFLNAFYNLLESISYKYAVSSQDSLMGSVSTTEPPTCNNNSVWTIKATPNSGYLFSHWSDRDTNSTRTLKVNKDTALVD